MPRTNLSSPTASTAVSWDPDLPAPGGLCAIHQPNLFPRLTTLAKLFAADYWIVLDDVQFTRRDYQHRARLAALGDPLQRQWLSIPTRLPGGRRTAIRNALIVDPMRSRRRTMQMLWQYFGSSPHWPALDQALVPVLDLFTTTGQDRRCHRGVHAHPAGPARLEGPGPPQQPAGGPAGALTAAR